jgi:hypothetical protein
LTSTPTSLRPVLKFINSPTERLIIADEVGLGKTIESALIWIELQARRQASKITENPWLLERNVSVLVARPFRLLVLPSLPPFGKYKICQKAM